MPKSRTAWCLRRTVKGAKGVDVLKSNEHGTAHFGNLITCCRVWSCPVCAAKISERRREELTRVVDAHRSLGGTALLVTYTHAHTRNDNLKKMLESQRKAFSYLKGCRAYRDLQADLLMTGSVRALEVTHGQSGWHPHHHEIWFLDLASVDDHHQIKERLFKIWRRACELHGLGLPTLEHGIDVRNGEYAAQYASKWGLEHELTKANIKTAKNGSRSPWQLIASYAFDRDKQAGALFREYVEAFTGKRQLVWSNGMKRLYDFLDTTDEEIAAEQDDSAELLGTIPLDEWKVILFDRGPRTDSRAIILSLAETGGWSAVRRYINDLKTSPPPH